MKRLFGLKKKKKKVKNDADLSYRPPPSQSDEHHQDQQEQQPQQSLSSHAAAAFPNNHPNRGHSSHTNSSRANKGVYRTEEGNGGNSNSIDDNASGVTSGYRYALTAYADTISPAISNEDGMGGGGGTLRSRSGRVRGSAGSKTSRGNLIPMFEDLGDVGSSIYNHGSGAGSYNDASSAGGVIAAALSRSNSPGANRSAVRQDRLDAYERRKEGEGVSSGRMATSRSKGATPIMDKKKERREGGPSWAAIPEEPRNSNSDLESAGRVDATGSIPVNEQESQKHHDDVEVSPKGILLDNKQHFQSTDSNIRQQPIPIDDDAAATRLRLSFSPSSNASHPITNNPSLDNNDEEKGHLLILQPDAIYQEHYGDAYVDQLIKYLYPAGYQSMRPRSGPWKLSIFIFLLFLWLSVFIVGHCYDRGQREYTNYFDNADDAYLQEVDDDMLVMETRWCGSKPLYFSWLVSVWITVMSMSYCSIIGYVKVRDIAVANGRSQPASVGMGTMSKSGRSDYYCMVENANVSGTCGGNAMNAVAASAGAAMSDGRSISGGYSSYQDGTGGNRRFAPSIYQSDGTPQFWGGHIYRPTQAAVAMTNRP